jgi:hypothetical protein
MVGENLHRAGTDIWHTPIKDMSVALPEEILRGATTPRYP